MRWNLQQKPPKEKVQALKESLSVNEAIATLLVQRGVETFDDAKKFFRPSLNDLHNPYLMKDMEKAVERIARAITKNEKILIFGDYDVDGTTAVSLLYSFFKNTYNNKVTTYIPDRYTEGYGISYKGIDTAYENNITLIIALDCGIKSIEHVAYAKEKNIDFIICDHHKPSNILPEAVAILNPKQKECNYPYDELCGCGVGFKLIQALTQKNGQTTQALLPYLDLVATAIAADIVPITGENRILAKFGLEVINTAPRPGIKALIKNIKKKNLKISDVVFGIAPRINAAGRIKHGNYAVKLLTEFNTKQAEIFALEIEQFNTERKNIDKQITKEALQQIKQNNEEDNFSTVVYNKNWHKGVIGIVASRLLENHYKPTIVFTKSGNVLTASARSVKGFDLYTALENCAEYLEQFGGHKYAAGMTLKEENYTVFKNAFEKEVQQSILPEMRKPKITVNLPLNFSDITPKFIRILNQFEPFGPQNMTPTFISSAIFDTGFGKTIGKENEHLKLFVKQDKITKGIEAIGFNLGKKLPLTTNRKYFNMIYTIGENQWNGTTNVQFQIKTIINKQ